MRTALRPLALLLSVSILTGCAVGPDYRSPEIDVAARFLGQDAIVHRDVQSKANLTAWWAGFDDPLLTRFISMGLEQNLDLAQAAALTRRSRPDLTPQHRVGACHCRGDEPSSVTGDWNRAEPEMILVRAATHRVRRGTARINPGLRRSPCSRPPTCSPRVDEEEVRRRRETRDPGVFTSLSVSRRPRRNYGSGR